MVNIDIKIFNNTTENLEVDVDNIKMDLRKGDWTK
jgi:hypothetical protein